MQNKDVLLSNQQNMKPPVKPEKPSNSGKKVVDDKNLEVEANTNEFKTIEPVKSTHMVPSEKVEVALDKVASILDESAVELTTVIESTIIESEIEKEEVLEKKSTISEKFLNMFFTSKKMEDVSNDDAPVNNIRDDIEDVIPVKEDMIRDEAFPLIEEESLSQNSNVEPEPEPELEHLVNELKEMVDLPELEKPVTTEIDIKFKTSYFFCCTM
jgi:hypothetical protein